MAGTEWKSWRDVELLSPGTSSGTLMQLSGKLVEESVATDSLKNYCRQALADISAELSLQWVGLIKRRPGAEWDIVSEQGRSVRSKAPIAFWDQALELGSGGLSRGEQSRFNCVFPLAEGHPVADLLVAECRHSDGDLLDFGLVTARTLSSTLLCVLNQASLRRQTRRLESTLEIAAELSTADDAAPLLDRIAEEVTNLLGCDRSSIFLWRRDRDEIEGYPALGVPGGSLRLPAGKGIVGETLKTGRPVLVPDAYADPRFNQEVDRQSGYQTRNLICVPLRAADGVVIGAFQAINRLDGGEFTEADVECLIQLGTQAAVALRNLEDRDRLNRSHGQLAEQVRRGVNIVGDSPAIGTLRDTVTRLASTDLPVLVLGESGTGKEVVAQSLHFGGSRADSPFVAVNCAALNENLLESELFGHERGAFTDARDMRPGRFELADGGTLFLDEIGDMSPGGQAKLLRVLEQRMITRVGGTEQIPVNVRVVAATNANLMEAVRERRFREDLYYRLGVVTVKLPPLRERPEDILPLSEYFLKQFSEQARRPRLQLSQDARRRLQGHPWPGNIRELRNLMERLAFLTQGDRVEVDDLAFSLSPDPEQQQLSLEMGLDGATREFQRKFIRRAIRQTENNVTEAAKLLNVYRANLYRKMKQLDMKEAGGSE